MNSEMRIACQDPALAEGFGMKNKPVPGLVPLLWVEVLHGGTIFKNEEEVIRP
jgi:hypothetical protein